MISIVRAYVEHVPTLSSLARTTFIESHGHSAPPEDVDEYVAKKYNDAIFHDEISNEANIYHILYYYEEPAGFSKIILNSPFAESTERNITKLERLYFLEKFHSLKLGITLFQFNLEFAKRNKQGAMWLFVWKQNFRAINFYKKNGFTTIGSHDFEISARHSNPNHQMLLKF